MHVVVIGAGLLGLTSAHYLHKAGATVTVLERREGPGLETSFANGALLHASLVNPWNAPGTARQLLKWLGRKDAPMLLRMKALPSLLGWGVRFLRNSERSRFEHNLRVNLTLAQYSLEMMRELRAETGIEYGQYYPGVMMVFRDGAALAGARETANLLASQGLEHEPLDHDGVMTNEPALQAVADQIVGGIRYPTDEGGDAHAFCLEMRRVLEAAGVRFVFHQTVDGFEHEGDQLRAAIGPGERFEADAFVVACGPWSTPMLSKLGYALPVRPVKGYSLTVPREPNDPSAPRMPVVDHGLHAALVPVGNDRLRVAGTAEFTGFNRRLDPARIANLNGMLEQVYPEFASTIAADRRIPWTGLRPMSPDGVPIIGAACPPGRYRNLYLNTGHGHIGWTTSAASGRLLADAVLGRPPAIDPAPYRPDRF